MKSKNTRATREQNRQRTTRIAASGMMIALGVIFLYIGSLIDTLNIIMAAVASLLCVMAVVDYGPGYAFMLYAGTGLAALLLLPEKFTPAVYLLLIGYYPMVKERLERLAKRGTEPADPKKAKHVRRLRAVGIFALKLCIGNAAIIALFLLARYVLLLPPSDKLLLLALWGMANVTFVLYDLALTQLISLYLRKRHKRFHLPGSGRREAKKLLITPQMPTESANGTEATDGTQAETEPQAASGTATDPKSTPEAEPESKPAPEAEPESKPAPEADTSNPADRAE